MGQWSGSALQALCAAVAGIIQEPMRLTWNAALEETEMVLFESVHKLFKATGVSAQDVSHSPALSWPDLIIRAAQPGKACSSMPEQCCPTRSIMPCHCQAVLTPRRLAPSHSALTERSERCQGRVW